MRELPEVGDDQPVTGRITSVRGTLGSLLAAASISTGSAFIDPLLPGHCRSARPAASAADRRADGCGWGRIRAVNPLQEPTQGVGPPLPAPNRRPPASEEKPRVAESRSTRSCASSRAWRSRSGRRCAGGPSGRGIRRFDGVWTGSREMHLDHQAAAVPVLRRRFRGSPRD